MLIAILMYRIAHEFYISKDEKSAEVLSNIGKFYTGIEIFYSSQIGSGLRIIHGVGSVIGARTIIGKNAIIYQNVTLGDKNGGRPQIGDNVRIYSGAKILGAISIGNNTIIGANAVCIEDVPANSIAVGVPARVISK